MFNKLPLTIPTSIEITELIPSLCFRCRNLLSEHLWIKREDGEMINVGCPPRIF